MKICYNNTMNFSRSFSKLLLVFLALFIFLAWLPQNAYAAVTATHLVSNRAFTDAAIFITASITPTANRLVLAAIAGSAAADPAPPTLSGNGLTWVQVATVAHGG